MIYLTHGTDYIPNTITRRFVISLCFWGVWGARYHLYRVQFVSLKILRCMATQKQLDEQITPMAH